MPPRADFITRHLRELDPRTVDLAIEGRRQRLRSASRSSNETRNVCSTSPCTRARDLLLVTGRRPRLGVPNGIDYLVTWNFKHIANAPAKRRIETACRHAGFECPVICSPDELVEDADDEP
jgi:hypothetical protein